MEQKIIMAILESLAVGDALGAPTEFMTRQQILEKFGQVNRLLSPELSLTHNNLLFAQVTDDTEQNIYLIREYCNKGRIDIVETAQCLLRWVKETGADEKKYIGPSSLKALKLIEEGEDPYKTGLHGTTCGGIMRTLSAVFCTGDDSIETLISNVKNCCIPTHNTSPALEAAMAYAFAMRRAFEGGSIDSIIDFTLRGAEAGLACAPYIMCAASSGERIKYLEKIMPRIVNDGELLDFLYNIYGAGLESEDICSAVFGIFLYARDDVWLAVRLGASLGGDTDTVAALAGALCSAYAKGHNIPAHILGAVTAANRLDFGGLSRSIARLWGKTNNGGHNLTGNGFS